MRRLPRLAIGSAIWELPLADCSALGLEEALLTSSGSDCRDGLAQVLTTDPALTLWVVCQAHVLGSQPLKTCRAAAEWLEADALARFDWQAGDTPGLEQTDPEAAGRYAALAATGVVTGALARQLAEVESGVCPDEALAAGLLHGARDWLDAAVVARGSAGAATACLPDWLLEPLTTGTDSRWCGGARACAARAVALLAEAEGAGDARATLAPDLLRDLERETAQRWRVVDQAVHRRLPALVTKLRRLADLEERFQTVLEAAKLDAMKELAYGASHEINNPLANISARAQTLLKEEHNAERRRKLAAINSQAFRAHEMIADLMLFARPPALQCEPIDLVGLVDTVAAELSAEARARGIELTHRRAPGAVIAMADEVQLAVALRAVCVNALEALGTSGQVWLEAALVQEGSSPPAAKVVVADNGPGIRAEIRRHLFDPFFSGREAGRGLGFGLSKCWRIVTDHKGRILVDSPSEGGAVFTIILPAAARPAPSPRDEQR